MNPALLSLAACVSTLGGGLFAYRFRDQLHYLLSFTAGVLLGVVAFELLPEIFVLSAELSVPPMRAMVALVAGFLLFHSLEKFVLIHHAHEADYAEHRHPQVGLVSAAALVGHSVLDGVGMGLAFQVSPTVGLTVAAAVIAHDWCDGLNTVGLMLSHRNATRSSLLMLLLDAAAPVLGVALTQVLQLPPAQVMLYLGFFAGFLLYIAVSDVLPEAHSRASPSTALQLIGLTLLGAVLVFGVSQLAG